jgi:hypothetical protein
MLRKVIKYRAVRPIVAVASLGNGFQSSPHRLHFRDAPVKVDNMSLGQCANFLAGAPLVLP